MASDEGVVLSERELLAFSEKLERWATTLSAREQAFLSQLLADARDAATEDIAGYANLETALAGDDDVAGFGLFSAPATLGGMVATYAAGLSEAEADFARTASLIQSN